MTTLELAGARATGIDAAPWVIVHVRPRQEKRLAADLERLGVPFELPTVRLVRAYEHRRRVVHLPLFPSYVFARAPEECFEAVRETGRVVRLRAVADQSRLEQDLGQIRRAIACGAQPTPCAAPRGARRVRVVSGRLSGVVGWLSDGAGEGACEDGKAWLTLELGELGRAVGVWVDRRSTAPLGEVAARAIAEDAEPAAEAA